LLKQKCKTLPKKKKLKQKKAGGMAQVVEYLPSKYKALSSNISTKKRTNKQKPKTIGPPQIVVQSRRVVRSPWDK
jgi:hypothetical protein